MAENPALAATIPAFAAGAVLPVSSARGLAVAQVFRAAPAAISNRAYVCVACAAAAGIALGAALAWVAVVSGGAAP